MDKGATLCTLLTFPVINKEEYLKQLDAFRGLLITSTKGDLKLILKQLLFLQTSSVFGQSLQIKFKHFIKKRLSGFDEETCPEVRETFLPVLKDASSLSYQEKNLDLRLFHFAKRLHRLIPLKVALAARRLAYFRLDKKLLKFIKSKIRIYRFFFNVFKSYRERVIRSQLYFESLLMSNLEKHGKVFRRNNKVKNFFGVFKARMKPVFIALSYKPSTSAPMTPRKSPKKRDYYLNLFLSFIEHLVHVEIKKRVSEVKKAFPGFNQKFKLNKFYNHFINFYKKCMFIKFFKNAEKKIKAEKILNFLFMSQLVKHGKNFSKSWNLRSVLIRLKNRKLKQIYVRLDKVNKVFLVIKGKCLQAAKIIDKVRVRKYGSRYFRMEKIFIGIRRVTRAYLRRFDMVIERLNKASKKIRESEKIIRKLIIQKKSYIVVKLNEYAKNFNKFGKIRNIFIKAQPLVLKKYVRKIAESLKGMKHDIHLISLNNSLKFSFMFMNFLGKSKKDLKFETIKTKINIFFKKKSWKKLKNCEKFYNYEFSEFITISNVSVSPNHSLLVSKEKNHSNTLSEQFLQLYSLINSSLKTQRLIYNKIEENCSNLSESLSMTKESLRSLDDSISEYDSKISSINANKSKVFHSNQLLEDWCNKSQVLEEDYKRLSKSIQQNMELDNSLESEVHQLTKSVAELSNACNDSELEISRIEFDYSHVVRERDSFRNSPERHTRLGLSPSPGRRSPVKARGSPLRDSFRSPVKSFVARSPISPDRSRARSRVYQE